MRARASAPGKVILLGEHFVVKGKRALAIAISLRSVVDVEYAGSGGIVIESRGLNARATIDPGNLEASDSRFSIFSAVLKALRDMGYSIVPHRAKIHGDLPIGAGLGSSAATSAAYALAYTAMHGDPLAREDLNKASYMAEVVAHGRPSGIDNTVSVYGGFIIYRRGEGWRRLEGLSLPKGYYLMIVDTGIERPTREAVMRVLRRAERAGQAASLIYEAADSLVDLAVNALASGDMRLLGEVMDLNQGLLYAMGVSLGEIEEILFRARSLGALGAKITGAGLGGSVIVLASEDSLDRLASGFRGHRHWIASPSSEGARLEDY